MEKKVVVLGTGGTIAGTSATAGDNIGYLIPNQAIDLFLAAGRIHPHGVTLVGAHDGAYAFTFASHHADTVVRSARACSMCSPIDARRGIISENSLVKE